MDFRKYLEKSVKGIDKEQAEIFKKQLKEAGMIDKKLMPLLRSFIKSCQGGKGIRGALVCLGHEIADGRSKEIIKVGAAYEILHSAILIHDDIIDQSNTRRNKPSLYKELGGNHYGISQAISLGDYGFFLAFRIISESGFPAERKTQALGLFPKVLMDTAWGEILDLKRPDPQTLMKLKTARYTIIGPLQLGAILAGAKEEQVKFLEEFGEKLGIAYQIQDDILDSEVDYLGGVENAKEEAVKYTDQAMKIIPEITKDKRMSKILEQMGEYLVRRTK